MKKIIILSSDTLHHRYFINKIIDEGINIQCCIFETTSVKAEFQTGPLFDDLQDNFEKENFFKNVNYELNNIKIIQVENINSNISLNEIKKMNPDFGVVFGSRKISNELIGLFKDGLINVHRGLSERYRGLDSDLWAIYHGDYNSIGVTIHFIDETLDTGNIVFKEKLELKKDMKIFQIRYYTTLIATELVIKSLKAYLYKKLISIPQEKGRYYSFMPLVLKIIVERKFNLYCSNKLL